MHKALMHALIIFAALIAAAGAAFGAFSLRNLYWYRAGERALRAAGAAERQAVLPTGRVINYGEIASAPDAPALLLIHGQMAAWEDYGTTMAALAESWHVYAVDVYGHGGSSHDAALYYLDVNGDDLIWFIDNIIAAPVVVCGHSNGAITAAYIAAYGGARVKGAVLEDLPVFSTQGEGWQDSFAYKDTYKPLHDYLSGAQEECWEAYYLRHCLWGRLYMAESMPRIADYAQGYALRHPGKEVKLFFMPPGAVQVFHYVRDYDMRYGAHFYDLTWHNGVLEEELLADISVPCIYLHARESRAGDGTYLCAASREQAMRAAELIGAQCTLIETGDSDHNIHGNHAKLYIDAVNRLFPED